MEKELSSVICGIISGIENDNKNAAAQLLEIDVVKDALSLAENGRIEYFYFSVLHPISSTIDGILQQVSGDHKVQFVLKHSQFIERHFEELIRRFEGFACYHLPTTIFKTHDEIIMFFDGIHSLYYGKHELYLKALSTVITNASKQKENV